MEVSTSLLVVLMFTSIVGIGIANILMAFTNQVSALAIVQGKRLGAAWLLIMLLSYLAMFWNSTLIIEREHWSYVLFLFVITGPVLLLFASSLMARMLSGEIDEQSPVDVEHALPRFFLIYALVQVWFIGMDYLLFDTLGYATVFSAGLGVAAVCLAIIRNQKLVWAFTIVILILAVLEIFLK